MTKENQNIEELQKIQEESESQERPDQKSVTSVSEKIRKRVHNLPDPTNPPLGYDEHKAFDRVFPYINIPALHPQNHGDTVIFNNPDVQANKLYLGDNLEVLRTLKTESIDLIYIDPPFFSGRNYNVIWGDSNEVRTFGDIWEGGITSYLIWLNARLWEMRRVLKKTGSIYVHCDWHASHYIKTEMDKIFGYENFRNEIVWRRGHTVKNTTGKQFPRTHDIIYYYSKSHDDTKVFNKETRDYVEGTLRNYQYADNRGKYRLQSLRTYSKETIKKFEQEDRIYATSSGKKWLKQYLSEKQGTPIDSFWDDIPSMEILRSEQIGYPTQKPEALLQRIIQVSSNENDVIADFFVGGGTTCAVAIKNKRRFIGCDSSRVAISVTLDRLVKIGEEMSGVKSNITTEGKPFQMGLQTEGLKEKVPNIEVNYLGIYPIEKFKNLNHDEFIHFVLTAYGASKNTGEGITHGYKPPAQQEPILVGPADPEELIDAKLIKKFYEEILQKVEPNKMIRAKVIAWKFPRQTLKYVKILQKYSLDNNLPIEIEAVPLDSKEFRKRILQRMPDVEEAELFLRFSKPPVIGDIKFKKIGELEYEFEAVDAFSTNEDGWLVNCQWDFDYQEGHFAADKEYVLSREKSKDKKRGEIFEAILTAKHKFDKKGKWVVACKIQDNLAGETIISKEIVV